MAWILYPFARSSSLYHVSRILHTFINHLKMCLCNCYSVHSPTTQLKKYINLDVFIKKFDDAWKFSIKKMVLKL